MSYGVPVSAIPTNGQGIITFNKHSKSLKKYLRREAALKQQDENGSSSGFDWDKAVFLPNKDDVLLGRG